MQNLDAGLASGAGVDLNLPMPRVTLAPFLMNACPAPAGSVAGVTVRDALEQVFLVTPALRSYVLDDQGAVRKHVTIFLDGEPITDRVRQSDAAREESEIFLMQALSGG